MTVQATVQSNQDVFVFINCYGRKDASLGKLVCHEWETLCKDENTTGRRTQTRC